ncbi:MAG: flavin reductase [Clostridia bacterium]|nr:flavin reductase [Clostridia bacterium]
MDKKAMYKLSYGLFVLTVNDGKKDSGCITNTVMMMTDNPCRIVVFVNNANYTAEVLKKTGVFNVSVLAESAPFDLFKRFGFQSGRDVDKFADTKYPRAENGLRYIDENANALISAKVVDKYDYGTHTLFVAEVTDAVTLSEENSVTYAYYQENIKPKANAPKEEGKEKWVCSVCGYVHEGPLPEDFVCPWCKHPASDFVKA